MKSFSKLVCSTLLSALVGVSLAGTAVAAEAPKTVSATQSSGNVIVFNRLMRKEARRHLPPTEDPLRDQTNPDVGLLQPPMDVYNNLIKMERDLGSGIAWVKNLREGKLSPRWDRNDPNAEPMVMDMSVVRVPRGKMPDVVFPHKAHTEILDCSNCHPDIFIPQKGANQISMAAIILGQKCGVCHGKVAFPIAECKICHSQPKQVAAGGK